MGADVMKKQSSNGKGKSVKAVVLDLDDADRMAARIGFVDRMGFLDGEKRRERIFRLLAGITHSRCYESLTGYELNPEDKAIAAAFIKSERKELDSLERAFCGKGR
jgi:hypothetical protein